MKESKRQQQQWPNRINCRYSYLHRLRGRLIHDIITVDTGDSWWSCCRQWLLRVSTMNQADMSHKIDPSTATEVTQRTTNWLPIYHTPWRQFSHQCFGRCFAATARPFIRIRRWRWIELLLRHRDARIMPDSSNLRLGRLRLTPLLLRCRTGRPWRWRWWRLRCFRHRRVGRDRVTFNHLTVIYTQYFERLVTVAGMHVHANWSSPSTGHVTVAALVPDLYQSRTPVSIHMALNVETAFCYVWTTIAEERTFGLFAGRTVVSCIVTKCFGKFVWRWCGWRWRVLITVFGRAMFV